MIAEGYEYIEGDKLYLVPLGARYGGLSGLRLGGSSLRFMAAHLYVRRKSSVVLDDVLAWNELADFSAKAPYELQSLIQTAIDRLAAPRSAMELPGCELPLPFTRPLVMGVLNVTPDSFSDGGDFAETGPAVAHAKAMIAAGADIIDIGGESTRPGARPVWEGDEVERVVPVIEALKDADIPISIDSRHSVVMKAAVQAGAHIINDVSALAYDPESLEIAADSSAPVILMHAQGTPATMQDAPEYDHVLLDVFDYLSERIEICREAGIDRSRIIVDPGIGFGKAVVQDNMNLMNGLALFHTLGVPVLLGASRKRFIGAATGQDDPKQRLGGSLAAALSGVNQGIQIIRVHDVAETAQALKMHQAMVDAGAMSALPSI